MYIVQNNKYNSIFPISKYNITSLIFYKHTASTFISLDLSSGLEIFYFGSNIKSSNFPLTLVRLFYTTTYQSCFVQG